MSSVRSCSGKVLHSSSRRYSSNDVNSRPLLPRTSHVPSVRCHHEVMSKLPNNYDTCRCQGDGDEYAHIYHEGYNQAAEKDRKKNNSTKSHKSSGFDRQQVDNRQGSSKKKSKSLSHLQKPNLEDSMDYVPVKLASDNCLAKRKKEEKLNKDKTVTAGSRKLTWDQIFRGESELNSRSRPNQHTNDVPKNSKRNNENPPTYDEGLSNKLSKNKGVDDESSDTSDKDRKQYKQQLRDSEFCPFTTLDMLISKLRGTILKQPENYKLQKIFVEMENTLHEIASDNYQFKKMYKEHCAKNQCVINPNTKSVLTDGNIAKERNSNLDDLRKGLEESCRYLQSLCVKQNEACNDYLREKEQLSLQLAESRRLLAVAKSKEKDYEVTIGDLRLKLQEANSKNDHQYHSEKELIDTVARLKTEIETLSCFKVAASKLKSRLKETCKEKEILRSRIYMKDLEIEKLKVLLEVKENLSPSFNITNKEIDLKSQENGVGLDLQNDVDASFTSIAMRQSCRHSWDPAQAELACSSQTSGSVRLSPTPYNSWRHISAIDQQPTQAGVLNQSIANLFKSLKMKTDQDEPPQLDLEMPSSASSFWSEKDEPIANSKKSSSARPSATTSS